VTSKESLLPGTDAIPRGTLEIARYRSGWLIRIRNLRGAVWQEKFNDPAEANERFRVLIAQFGDEVRKAFLEWEKTG
jgi:hypothetical protein